jgi:hypothetical protein
MPDLTRRQFITRGLLATASLAFPLPEVVETGAKLIDTTTIRSAAAHSSALSAYDNVLKQFYLPAIKEQLSNSALFDLLKANKTEAGKVIIQPIRYGKGKRWND